MNMHRRTGLIAISVAVIGALVWGFMPSAVTVDAVLVTRGAMEVTISEEGETRLLRRYKVTAPLSGTGSRIDEPG